MARAPLARPTDVPPPAPAVEAASREPSDGEADEPVRPAHVAIIMDGNRRWAREHGRSELEGHAAGVEKIRWLVEHTLRRGVAVLSLYAFSRENWGRPDDEVVGLFRLLEQAIRAETPELVRQGVRVRLLGRLDELPDDLRRSIDDALAATEQGDRLTLAVAFNYAGRTELVDAVRAIVSEGLAAEAIDESTVAARLYTVGMPDPGPRDPDGRRAAALELPDLAERLRGVLVLRPPLAGLRRGGLRRRPRCVRPALAALRNLGGPRRHTCASALSAPC